MLRIVPVALAATVLTLTGCQGEEAPRTPTTSAAPASELTGKFVVEHAEVDGELADLAADLEESGIVEQAADLVNARVVLPKDVTITVDDCDEGTGFDDESQTISVCLADVADFAQMVADGTKSGDIRRIQDDILLETVTHECGHAVLAVLDAPFVGQEEDVADQFSAYVLLGADASNGREVLGSVAQGYRVSDRTYEPLPADEHAGDAQRAVNMLCWAYGADPDGGDSLVGKNGLTEERADFCSLEWDDLESGWDDLLADAGGAKAPVG